MLPTYPALTFIPYRSHWAISSGHPHDTGLLILVELPPTPEGRHGIEIGLARTNSDGLTPSLHLRTWAERCGVTLPHSWANEQETRTGLQETIGHHLDTITSHPEAPPTHPILV